MLDPLSQFRHEATLLMSQVLAVIPVELWPRIQVAEERLRCAYDELVLEIQSRAAELQQANRKLQDEVLERKRMEREILNVSHQEQKRFGSQLHDGLCQDLTGILFFAKGLAHKMERENRLDVAELLKISDLLHGAIHQARQTARGLYPGELEGPSLMLTLEELASNTTELSGVSCCFHCPERIVIEENETATHLYKIAQEAVGNAVSHGKPQSIEVSLVRNQGAIVLTITDNGVGFSADTSCARGIGLKIMKYRADIIGAVFSVTPNVPMGVVVQCTVPATPQGTV